MTRPKTKKIPEKLSDPGSGSEITSLFLSKGMDIKEEFSGVYNLQDEFAASKSNKSIPVYAAVIIFTVVLLAATIWLTWGIQRDIDRIKVGISEFKDLNLAELLAALKKAELELTVVDDKIAMSKKAMEMEVEKIKRLSDLEIKKVEASGLGQAEKNRLIKRIMDEQNNKMKASQKTYDDRIKDSEKKAAEMRNKMDALNKKVALEKTAYEKSVKKEADSQILAVVKSGIDMGKAHDKEIEEQKKEYKAVMAEYEKELKAAKNDTVKEAEKARDTEDLLKLYRQALLYYSKTRGEHGYVIDPGEKGNMLLDINPYISIKKGDRAYVLNQENKVLAIVELNPSGIRMKAKLLKRVMQGEIKPFDKILLIKN